MDYHSNYYKERVKPTKKLARSIPLEVKELVKQKLLANLDWPSHEDVRVILKARFDLGFDPLETFWQVETFVQRYTHKGLIPRDLGTKMQKELQLLREARLASFSMKAIRTEKEKQLEGVDPSELYTLPEVDTSANKCVSCSRVMPEGEIGEKCSRCKRLEDLLGSKA